MLCEYGLFNVYIYIEMYRKIFSIMMSHTDRCKMPKPLTIYLDAAKTSSHSLKLCDGWYCSCYLNGSQVEFVSQMQKHYAYLRLCLCVCLCVCWCVLSHTKIYPSCRRLHNVKAISLWKYLDLRKSFWWSRRYSCPLSWYRLQIEIHTLHIYKFIYSHQFTCA